ncbi:hypothetical protein H0H93_013658, partial [Arthromyces matolae]
MSIYTSLGRHLQGSTTLKLAFIGIAAINIGMLVTDFIERPTERLSAELQKVEVEVDDRRSKCQLYEEAMDLAFIGQVESFDKHFDDVRLRAIAATENGEISCLFSGLWKELRALRRENRRLTFDFRQELRKAYMRLHAANEDDEEDEGEDEGEDEPQVTPQVVPTQPPEPARHVQTLRRQPNRINFAQQDGLSHATPRPQDRQAGLTESTRGSERQPLMGVQYPESYAQQHFVSDDGGRALRQMDRNYIPADAMPDAQLHGRPFQPQGAIADESKQNGVPSTWGLPIPPGLEHLHRE